MDWRCTNLEEEKGNHGGWVCGNSLGEIEGSEEWRGVEECGEKSEDRKDIDLGYEEQLARVKVVPVTEFVC
jgi:hypothetical protein